MDEVKPISVEEYEFEYRAVSKLIALFAVFALNRQKKNKINLFVA